MKKANELESRGAATVDLGARQKERWLRFCLSAVVVGSASINSGCGHSDASGMAASAAAEPLTSDPNLGRRDWPVDDDGFAIDNPSGFAFFDEIDSDSVAAAMDAGPRASSEPIVLAEDTEEAVRRALDHEPASPTALLDISRDHVAGELAFAFTAAAEKLVTYGRDLRVWDVAAGKVEQALAPAVGGVIALVCDKAGKHVVLAGKGTLTSVDLETGDIVAQISDLKGDVVDWQRARDEDLILGRTSRDQVFVTTPRLSRFTYIPVAGNAALQNLMIAPHGAQIASTRDDYGVLWQKGDGAPLGDNQVFGGNGSIQTAAIGSTYLYWATPDHLFRQPRPGPSEVGMSSWNMESARMAWKARQVWSLTRGNGEDWPLVWGRYQLPDDEPTEVIFDFDYQWDQVQSSPWLLDAPQPQRIVPNDNGTRIAILRSSGLTVYQRERWHPTDEKVLKSQVYHLTWQGRFDQLEQISRAILEEEPQRFGLSAAELHVNFAQSIGWAWYSIEQDEEKVELRRSLEEWRASESDLAIVASACRHIQTGWAARGGGYANAVSDDGWRIFRERLQLARGELNVLLERNSPPLAAFCKRIEIAKGLSEDYEVIDPILKRAVELYPGEALPHTEVAVWLLPRWGGAIGAVGRYARKLTDIYPPEVADAIVARMAIELHGYAPNSLFAQEIGIDYEQTLNGAERLMDQGYRDRDGIESLWRVSALASKPESRSRLMNYHRRHFAAYGQLYRDQVSAMSQ